MLFSREYLPSIFDELKPLLEKHWREIAHYQDILLDPDWDAYKAAEDGGMFRAFTARTESGELVGYCFYFVRQNIHYKASKQAAQDILFIDPAHRRGSLGTRFIKWCDEHLASEGVQAVYQHVKAQHNFGPLLERQGYQLVDLIYSKRLDSTGGNS